MADIRFWVPSVLHNCQPFYTNLSQTWCHKMSRSLQLLIYIYIFTTFNSLKFVMSLLWTVLYNNSVGHTKCIWFWNKNIENCMPLKYFVFTSVTAHWIWPDLYFYVIFLVLGCHKWSSVSYQASTDPQGADCTFWCRFCCQRNVVRFQ